MQHKTIHEHLIDVGDKARIERRSRAEHDAAAGALVYKWVVYKKVHTGIDLHDEHRPKTKTGAHLTPEGIVHPHMVKRPGKHPVIKDDDGQAAETHFETVWVPVAVVASRDEALAKAAQI